MPIAFVIAVEPANAAPLPNALGECIHAAFFSMLDVISPQLAREMHGIEARKPFTLSSLYDRRNERTRSILTGLRVTLLDDALFPLILDALLSYPEVRRLRIGEADWTATEVYTSPQSHSLAAGASYADLVEAAEPVARLSVRFHSPTVFRSQKRDVVWPEPRLVWQSWARAWQDFSDTPLPDEAQIAAWVQEVAVAEHRIETNRIRLIESVQSGFVGRCTYDLTSLSLDAQRTLTTLADFASYSGTGRKTTLGLGQTSRSKSERRA